MTLLAIRALAFATLFTASIAGAVLNGPVGTACGGTTASGTVYSGTQGWSINPTTGQGYWSCCTAGTSCVGRDKPANLGALIDPRAPGTATAAPTRPLRHPAEQAPAQPERHGYTPREHGH